jgi:hypothetical protein
MPFLLLTPREDIRDSFRLAEAARQRGWRVERVSSYQPNREQYPENDIVFWGETFFTTLVSQRLTYVILEPDFDQLAKFPPVYLKRDVQVTTLEEARRISTALFAKPADGNKAFESQVYQNGAELPSRYLSKTLPVLVSTPVEWAVEYRFFILERAIAAYSVYGRHGQLALDEQGNWTAPESEQKEAVAFCVGLLQDERVILPPAVVLDVGIIADKGWALIEPNPVSSSGIYGCDPQKVLPVLQRASILESAVNADDRRWISHRPL